MQAPRLPQTYIELKLFSAQQVGLGIANSINGLISWFIGKEMFCADHRDAVCTTCGKHTRQEKTSAEPSQKQGII